MPSEPPRVGPKERYMGSEFGSYTEWLIEEIEAKADWRARNAEEYPEDEQNLRSSQALRNLTTKMKELPADHPKIQELWRLWFGPALPGKIRGPNKALDLIEIVSEELHQYGFYSDSDPEPFLDSLITALERKLGRSLSNPPERTPTR